VKLADWKNKKYKIKTAEKKKKREFFFRKLQIQKVLNPKTKMVTIYGCFFFLTRIYIYIHGLCILFRSSNSW